MFQSYVLNNAPVRPSKVCWSHQVEEEYFFFAAPTWDERQSLIGYFCLKGFHWLTQSTGVNNSVLSSDNAQLTICTHVLWYLTHYASTVLTSTAGRVQNLDQGITEHYLGCNCETDQANSNITLCGCLLAKIVNQMLSVQVYYWYDLNKSKVERFFCLIFLVCGVGRGGILTYSYHNIIIYALSNGVDEQNRVKLLINVLNQVPNWINSVNKVSPSNWNLFDCNGTFKPFRIVIF